MDIRLFEIIPNAAYVPLPRSQTSGDEFIQLPRIALCNNNTIFTLHMFPALPPTLETIRNAIVAVYYHKPSYEIG